MKTIQQTILETYLQPLAQQTTAEITEIEDFLKKIADGLTQEDYYTDKDFKSLFHTEQQNTDNTNLKSLTLSLIIGF